LRADQPKPANMSLSELRRLLMNPPSDTSMLNPQWESVHLCPRCRHILNLEEINLRTITTGIVECPKCLWEGPIEIQVIDVSARS